MESLSKNIFSVLVSFMRMNEMNALYVCSKKIKGLFNSSTIDLEMPVTIRNFFCPSVMMIKDAQISNALFIKEGMIKFNLRKLNLSFTGVTNDMIIKILNTNLFLQTLTINSCHHLGSDLFEKIQLQTETAQFNGFTLEEINILDNPIIFTINKPGLEKALKKLKTVRLSNCHKLLYELFLILPCIQTIQTCEESKQIILDIETNGAQVSPSLKLLIYPFGEGQQASDKCKLRPHPRLDTVSIFNSKTPKKFKSISSYVESHRLGYRQPRVSQGNDEFQFQDDEKELISGFKTLVAYYSFNVLALVTYSYDIILWAISKHYYQLANYFLGLQNYFYLIKCGSVIGYVFDGTIEGIEKPIMIAFNESNSQNKERNFIYNSYVSLPYDHEFIPTLNCTLSCYLTNNGNVSIFNCSNHFQLSSVESFNKLIQLQNSSKVALFSFDKVQEITHQVVSEVFGSNNSKYHNSKCCSSFLYQKIYYCVSKCIYKKEISLSVFKEAMQAFPEILLQEANYLGNSYSVMKSFLIIAIENFNMEIAEYLISNKHGFNLKDKCMWTPLHQAAAVNNIEAAELLIKYDDKININATEWNNKTPLYIAAQNNFLPMYMLLLKHNANEHITDIKKRTPYQAAVLNNSVNIVQTTHSVCSVQ